MKILVTGANGYLGQGIVAALLDRGNEVIAVDQTTEHVHLRATKINGDIFSFADPFRTLGCPDVLLHLAWTNGFLHDSPAHMAMLPAHATLLEKMAIGGVKMISVMGTMHEIGFYEGCISETTPCMPTTRYGIAKDALRKFTMLICNENHVVFQWLRGFYIVGNSTSGASVFSKITAAEARGDAEFPFTTGLNQYDFLDYEAFCAQTATAVQQMDIAGIMQICSGYPEKLRDRAERFIAENNYKIRLSYGRYPDRVYDSKAVWGDATKIKQLLGVKPWDLSK